MNGPFGEGGRFAFLRPDLSRQGLVRLATRSALACGVVGLLSVLAGWSASGFLDRNGLGRLISMRNGPPPQLAEAGRSKALDRGRLKALAGGESRNR